MGIWYVDTGVGVTVVVGAVVVVVPLVEVLEVVGVDDVVAPGVVATAEVPWSETTALDGVAATDCDTLNLFTTSLAKMYPAASSTPIALSAYTCRGKLNPDESLRATPWPNASVIIRSGDTPFFSRRLVMPFMNPVGPQMK